MAFDSSQCLSNIRSTAKEKNIKIGDLEEAAKVSKGYLSRLDKRDASSLTMEVLVRIAEQLGVTVDYLLTNTLNELTENEQQIVQFLDKLESLTKGGKLEWFTDVASYLRTENQEPFSSPHPLIGVGPSYSEEFEVKYYSTFYSSPFTNDYADLVDNCYHVSLPGPGDVSAYIMRVQYKTEEYPAPKYSEFFLIQHDSVKPICSSKFVRDKVAEKLESLYDTIRGRNTNIGLDAEAKSFMSDFISNNL